MAIEDRLLNMEDWKLNTDYRLLTTEYVLPVNY